MSAKKPSAVALASLRSILVSLKGHRKEQDAIKGVITEEQSEALAALKLVDPKNVGVEVEFEGEKFAAFYQQNVTPESWDMAGLVAWLKVEGMWDSVSTRILDPKKLEAELESGNISRAEIQRFKVLGTAPQPFVRFGRVTGDSIK